MVDHLKLALGSRIHENEADVKIEMKKVLPKMFPGATFYWAPGSRFGKAGQPDLIMCYLGVSVHVEVKREGEKPTQLQMARLKAHLAAGGISAYVAGKIQILSKFKFIKEECERRSNHTI